MTTLDTSYIFTKKDGWQIEFVTKDNITIYKNKKTGEKRFAFGNASWKTGKEARAYLEMKVANSQNQR